MALQGSALQGNAVIGQSGGPTVVINQSLVGLIEGCRASDSVRGIYGARRGIRGVLDEDFIDLAREAPEDLDAVARTPAAALRSIRLKPTEEHAARMLDVFRAHDVRFFFYIGGNDSAETAHLLNEAAVAANYELRLFHVPKTIDNDLRVTDHCPGYGSAARFVAQALMGNDQDNRSLGGVKIDILMGRNAGWLTAASRLARVRDDDGPHLIYLPERDFHWDAFLGAVAEVYSSLGRCVIAVSEGIHDSSGQLIAKTTSQDAFGNIQLSGSGALGDLLASRVKEHLGQDIRVRADTLGYLQRSYMGVVSEVDAREAREVGRVAVEVATRGDVPHGSMVILRDPSASGYRPRFDVTELSNVARETRELDEQYIEGDHDVSASFFDYALPLVGELPRPGSLVGHPIAKRL